MIADGNVKDVTLKLQQEKTDSLSLKNNKQGFNVNAFCEMYKTKLQEIFEGHCSKGSKNTAVCNTCQTVIRPNNLPLYIRYLDHIKSDKLKPQQEYSCTNTRSKKSGRGCKCKNTLSGKVLNVG